MSLEHYIQVKDAPRKEYSTPSGTEYYVPPDDEYGRKNQYTRFLTGLLDAPPTRFASMSTEAEGHLRARITISEDKTVLILDNIENREAGRGGKAPKIKDLVARCLVVLGVANERVNFILIPNIDNANTMEAMNAHGRWDSDESTRVADRDMGSILESELGRTAGSVARKLGKQVSRVYVGRCLGERALGFYIGSDIEPSRHDTPTPVPSAAINPNPAPIQEESSKCCVIL